MTPAFTPHCRQVVAAWNFVALLEFYRDRFCWLLSLGNSLQRAERELANISAPAVDVPVFEWGPHQSSNCLAEPWFYLILSDCHLNGLPKITLFQMNLKKKKRKTKHSSECSSDLKRQRGYNGKRKPALKILLHLVVEWSLSLTRWCSVPLRWLFTEATGAVCRFKEG